MNRTLFSPEHELFREGYRQFLRKEVAPQRESWRKAGIVPREMFRKMGDHGYLCIWADEKYGGLGVEDFRWRASGRARWSKATAGC